MKRFLRYLTIRGTYVLALLVLSGAHSLVSAQPLGPFEGCGTLIHGLQCRIFVVGVGEDQQYYYLENYGGFDVGDQVLVIGTLYNPGPSPCYVADIGIINNCIFSCETTSYVKPDGSGDFPTIQAAIDSAADGHTIVLTDGIFSGPGNWDIDYRGKAITLQSCGGDPDSCIIDCGGNAADPHRGFFFHSGEGAGAILMGVTVRNARDKPDWYGGGGAGVLCDHSSPTFVNCVFANNSAVYWHGGAMHFLSSTASIVDCTFLENSAAPQGGAIYSEDTSLNIVNCVFSGNTGIGAVFCLSGSDSLYNCTFTGNSTGMVCRFTDTSLSLVRCSFSESLGPGFVCEDGSATFSECEFVGNMGRGLDCTSYSAPTFNDCMFRDNSGGGMTCQEGCNAVLTRCTFSGNSAAYGGGMSCSEGSSPTLVECTFSENSASLFGGGLYCRDDVSVVMENTIIAFSTQGQAVWCDSTTPPLYPPASATLTCCDVYGNAGGDWIGCIADQYGVGGNVSEDPRFCGPAGSGDFRLDSASPCAPANSPCGGLFGAWPVGCVIEMAMECPDDLFVPGNSTIESVSLVGFRITNHATQPLAFDYDLTTDGPMTMTDKGDPAALLGTTPTLGPGATYYPPEAALLIPEIREHVEQMISYHVSSGDYSYLQDSCSTLCVLDPPVPVFVSDFKAAAVDCGVALNWDIVSDENVKGFRIYRDTEGSKNPKLVNTDKLVPATAREYVDHDTRAGRTYEYTLGIVLADDSESISQTLTVKTNAYELALHQNHPNPFNPSTTISFTLPKQVKTNLSVYDIEGKLVSTLMNETLEAGLKEVIWSGKDARGNRVSSGVYFYRLTAGNRTLTKKMVLLK